MPTGYTSIVQNGDVSFKQFALTCARAFGACINQRDEPMDQPPALQKPSNYHADKISELMAEQQEVEKMSDILAGMKALDQFEQQRDYIAKKEADWAAVRNNYEAMLAQVKAWEPPTDDHIGIKEFMENQLKESIKFDTTPYEQEQPVLLTASEFKEKRLAEIERDLEYHQTAYAKEVERTEERNKWISELYASLPE